MKTENDVQSQCQQPAPGETLQDSPGRENLSNQGTNCSKLMKLATDLKTEARQENEEGEIFERRSHCVKKNRETKAGRSEYVCEDCGAAFSQRNNLKSHIQGIHSDEKAFKCHECDASFACAAYLKRHIVIHTSEMKYKCDKCYRSFLRSTTLSVHKLTHTGEKNLDVSIVMRDSYGTVI